MSSLRCLKIKSEKTKKVKIFEHTFQLELRDYAGFPVPNTQFDVKVTIRQDGRFVVLQLPAINFQTGPAANNGPESANPVVINGGYLYTASGFLPPELRPNDIIPRSYFGPSNNGPNLPFSYSDSPSQLPVPTPGYLIQIDNAGALIVQGIEKIGNIIPPGFQNLLPTTISYIVNPYTLTLKKNLRLSSGFINTTKFTSPVFINAGLRDTHVNDAYNGIVAWAWSDNSTTDQTQGFMDLNIAIGRVQDSKIVITSNQKVTKPSDFFIPNYYVWDTAIAISRINPNLIVASFGEIFFSLPYIAVSTNGGQTWTVQPMPATLLPIEISFFGDNRGVAGDKFGNFWYLTTNLFSPDGVFVNTPYITLSTDGFNWTIVYVAPLDYQGAPLFYDYPQFCFGNDDHGNYGVWMIASANPNMGEDTIPFITFIPVTGLGADKVGTPQNSFLPQFLNNATGNSITASDDGKVFTLGDGEEVTFAYPGTAILDNRMLYKSPGPIDSNWAGPWDNRITNNIAQGYSGDGPTNQYLSQPLFGMFNSIQTNIYDDRRKALYSFTNGLYLYNSQNDRLLFYISRNNGQTFSNPIDISNTDIANRGFQSMALDPVTGDLAFGWYDGRNDPTTFTNLQYFGAVLDAATLDRLVEKIPLSDPVYSIPPGGFPQTPSPSTNSKGKTTEKVKDGLKSKYKKRVELIAELHENFKKKIPDIKK
jgi:hypothetical protein